MARHRAQRQHRRERLWALNVVRGAILVLIAQQLEYVLEHGVHSESIDFGMLILARYLRDLQRYYRLS